jgi:hypothetical protein
MTDPDASTSPILAARTTARVNSRDQRLTVATIVLRDRDGGPPVNLVRISIFVKGHGTLSMRLGPVQSRRLLEGVAAACRAAFGEDFDRPPVPERRPSEPRPEAPAHHQPGVPRGRVRP